MNDPIYVDVNDDGEEDTRTITKKALEPKTELQKLALDAVGGKRFPSKPLHTRFRNIETRCAASTKVSKDEAKVYLAWVNAMIAWAKKLNSAKPSISLQTLIAVIENNDKWNEFKLKNWDKVIATKLDEVKKDLPKVKFANRGE